MAGGDQMANGTIRCGSMMRRGSILPSLLLASLMIGGPAGRAEEGVSFDDQNGRAITLAQPATRVVTIPKPAASMFVAVDGASSKLVGMHPQSKTALLEKFSAASSRR